MVKLINRFTRWLNAIAEASAAQREAETWRLEACRERQERQKFEQLADDRCRLLVDLRSELWKSTQAKCRLEAECRALAQLQGVPRVYGASHTGQA